ncbi:phage major capsid protein [Tissierella pigra]|uniref:phage major capsid protein n=1 Tax=Tissierella pigra TaxID=2607614 RepID=UPI001C128ED5|nr:phage major capsid protein [Tissierella pigra]MBU5425009.1 phage major capsid protein [Tissierella pigra]
MKKFKLNLQRHAIPNPDLIEQKKNDIKQRLNQALKEGNENDFAQAFTEFADDLQQSVIQEAQSIVANVDRQVLATRGVRQLTSEENNYYQKVIEAMKSADPKQALTTLDVVLPTTTIDAVFEDLTVNHPLLSAIDFQNAGAVTEWLLNSNPRQLASWSPLCAEIVKELTSGFRKIDLQQNKLSAFIPVCKAMLDLGPVWLDRYVRTILAEALALGLEDGILSGRGQTLNLHEPIGMRKNLAGSVDPNTGYPDKSKVALNALDPITYGNLLATLSETENGNPRIVNDVILVVNPKDYLTKIMPATTPRATDGTYTRDVFPFPTTVIQSVVMAEGEAILGIGNRYLMAAGTGKSGKIEYSDEYRFLEDERVYLTKFYGHGQPKDNNSFILLDVTNLKPTVMEVKVTNIDEFPVA